MVVRTRNILSLCAGVGGLELGVMLALHCRAEAGRGICYVEREAAAAASLVASMEGGWLHPAPVWSDMLTFDARPWRGLVHILASGDPCQDNSVAGKRAGADGQRFLAPEVVRIASECRPDVIVRENVPGNADGQLHAIVPALEGLGYRVAAGIFSSAETGNTMRRERLIIMAVADGGLSGDRGLQRSGELRLLAQGDGSGGCAAPRMEGARGGRCGDSIKALRAGRDGAVDASRPMGRSEGERRGEGRTEPAREQRRRPASGSGSAMAGTDGVGRWPEGDQRGASNNALQRCLRLAPTVIPGPTDSRWIDVLDRWPELQPALSKEEAESHLRRGIDAMAHRIERLRATGNGVDPVVGAYAFLRLSALLAETRTSTDTVLRSAA